MAIRYYDEALVEKIKNWVVDPNMRVLTPQDSTRLFQMVANQTNDQPLKLPLIAISRDSNVEIISTTKKALSYQGATLEVSEDYVKKLNAIPIKISYQLDIYSRYFEEADEYLRNFIFNLINDPVLTIRIPYNGSNFQHMSTILLESDVADNSDIPERFVAGQFTRMTLKLTIDDAWLFSIPFMKTWKLEMGDLVVKD